MRSRGFLMSILTSCNINLICIHLYSNLELIFASVPLNLWAQSVLASDQVLVTPTNW